MPTMTPATAKKAAAALSPAERLAILEKLVNSAQENEDCNGEFAYFFDEFYIEFPGFKGECSLYKKSCQNHINDHANVIAAYLAGIAEFTVEPFKDEASYNAALKKAVEDIAKQDWDCLSESDYEEMHDHCKRLLKAAPPKPQLARVPRKKKKAGAK